MCSCVNKIYKNQKNKKKKKKKVGLRCSTDRPMKPTPFVVTKCVTAGNTN